MTFGKVLYVTYCPEAIIIDSHQLEVNCCLGDHFWPPGKIVGKSDGLTELLHIPNSARVVSIKDPQPGMWSIKVNNSLFTWECVWYVPGSF